MGLNEWLLVKFYSEIQEQKGIDGKALERKNPVMVYTDSL